MIKISVFFNNLSEAHEISRELGEYRRANGLLLWNIIHEDDLHYSLDGVPTQFCITWNMLTPDEFEAKLKHMKAELPF